jgi:hypothetical protein
MDKNSKEYQRVREEIRRLIDSLIVEKYHLIHQVDKEAECADQILSIEGLAIKADDQKSPEPKVRVRGNYNVGYATAKLDMLYAGFRKVI